MKRKYKILSVEDKFKQLAVNHNLYKDIKDVDLNNVKYTDIKFVYSIYNIDFRVIFDQKWFELDIIDLSLFKVIERLLRFTKQKPKTIDDHSGEWYYLSEEKIMLECPFIPLSSAHPIRNRMKKLENRKLLEACPDNQKHNLKYFRLGINAELLSGITRIDNEQY